MKNLIRYLPTQFLLCIILGICCQFYLRIYTSTPHILFLLTVLSGAFIILFYLLKRKILFSVCSWLLFLLIGITAIYYSNAKNKESYYEKKRKNNSTCILRIDKFLKTTNYYQKFEATVLQVDSIKTVGKILVNIAKSDNSQELLINNKIVTQSTFTEIPIPLNPYAFDYKSYLSKQGIDQQLFLTKDDYSKIDNHAFSFVGFLSSFRKKIQTLLKKQNFKKEELDIIYALLLGQKQEISKELVTNYANAGVIHILAISGLHIGILLIILTKLLQPLEILKNGKLVKTSLIITSLWVFALFTGLSASVVRATCMFTFVALGNSLQKKSFVEHSLVTSMLIILLIKPLFLFDVGFQLSYIAVFSIVWIQPLLYKLWKPNYNILDKAWQLITVSLAAQIGILPISLYYFHQFPSLFLLANIVIIPVLGMILLGGFILILLALLNLLPNFIVVFYSYLIRFINKFVYWISLQEEFLFTNISMSFLRMISLYVVLLFSFHFILKKTPKRFVLLLFAIILFQSNYLIEKQHKESKQELIVFHKSKNSLLAIRKGSALDIYHQLDSMTLKKDRIINSYKIGNNISKSINHKNRRVYKYKEKHILCVDSLGIYDVEGIKNAIVILQFNPKINLERLINLLAPQQIIADGSNYKSSIKRWKETCKKKKTPFYFTGKNGAFIIE